MTASPADGLSGRLEGRNVRGQKIIITLQVQSPGVTKITISVGTFDTQANRADAQVLYDELLKRF